MPTPPEFREHDPPDPVQVAGDRLEEWRAQASEDELEDYHGRLRR